MAAGGPGGGAYSTLKCQNSFQICHTYPWTGRKKPRRCPAAAAGMGKQALSFSHLPSMSMQTASDRVPIRIGIWKYPAPEETMQLVSPFRERPYSMPSR